MNQISKSRLAELEPGVAAKAAQLAEMLATEGIDIEITQGLRTYAEQDDLYAQGRTKPGLRVTNAKGGESWHNFGLCFDCAPFINGGHLPDWNVNHSAWARILTVGKSLGLRDGVAWRDEPHLQLEELPVNPTDAVRQAFLNGGLSAAWSVAVDKPAGVETVRNADGGANAS